MTTGMQVLLLNAGYEPLAVIPFRRAVSLVLKERVDPACEDTLTLQGVSWTLEIPVVVRLRHYINVPRRVAPWSRRAVLERDRYTCAYCGVQVGDRCWGYGVLTRQDFTVDHILPRSRGGRNTWSNTVCACPRCNQRKGNRTPHQAGMRLLWEPKRPRVNYLVVTGEIPTAWKVYLEL